MNNFIKIMALQEDQTHGVSFVSPREEGGINAIFDPESNTERHQVFIHSRLPYQEVASWDFATFKEARKFAATQFKDPWEVLSWNFKTKRPCEEEGVECGQRSCETCKSLSGEEGKSACSACGILDD